MAKKRAKKGEIWRWIQTYSDGEEHIGHLLFLQRRKAYNITDKKLKWWWDVLILDSGNYETYAVSDLFQECWDEPCGSDGLTNTETWERVG